MRGRGSGGERDGERGRKCLPRRRSRLAHVYRRGQGDAGRLLVVGPAQVVVVTFDVSERVAGRRFDVIPQMLHLIEADGRPTVTLRCCYLLLSRLS